MSNKNGGGVPAGMPQATPIIGQRFLETDVPAQFRKVPLGVPLPLAGLFAGDKEQMDRIEEKLGRLLSLLESEGGPDKRSACLGHPGLES